MLETIRARLTLWYVSVLGTVLIVAGAATYALLARALEGGVDANLRSVMAIAATSLANDLAEGQDIQDAGRSTSEELSSSEQMLMIFDGDGRLLAEAGREPDLDVALPPLAGIPSGDPLLYTASEADEADDRHRIAVQRITVSSANVPFIVIIGNSLEAMDHELGSLRGIAWYVIPLGLAIAGAGGWFLARQSLKPVMAMAEQARKIGGGDIRGRLLVANPRDELGRLAETFNELLARLGASLIQQRQFMADASHELRTPVATARTAAGVALQQPHRPEGDYREALQIIEQQTARLSRIVEDLFTLARTDAGNYPVRESHIDLEEIVDDVVRAARVLAAARQVAIIANGLGGSGAPLRGDDELIKRMIVNLIDNAVRHAPVDSAVTITIARLDTAYRIAVTDGGPGIPPDQQPLIFERFYRGDPARGRDRLDDGGAGLGLALARWIARVHGGDVTLAASSENGTTFEVILPAVHPDRR